MLAMAVAGDQRHLQQRAIQRLARTGMDIRLALRQGILRPDPQGFRPFARPRLAGGEPAQVAREDFPTGRDHREAPAEVFQLAHVAGILALLDQLHRATRETLRRQVEIGRRLGEEMFRKQGNIAAPLPQRRQRNTHHVQAVLQVGAEQAGSDAGVQVLMRGGDDAHVAAQRLATAHAVILATGQHAQQARLQAHRHVADLIEEQRAALGLLEAADMPACRAGKGARLVAKQFAFQQLSRNRGGVQRHIRLAATCAFLMQRTGHQFLARPRLAGDQHVEVAGRHAPDQAKHLAHRRALAEQGVRILAQLGNNYVLARRRQRTFHRRHRLIEIERLGDIVHRARAIRGGRGGDIGKGAHDDHRADIAPGQIAQQPQAILARHAHVGDQQRRARILKCRPHCVARAEFAHGMPRVAQRLRQHETHAAIVVEGERRFARPAGIAKITAMLLRDLARQGETQARPIGTAGHQRLEQAVAQLVGHARTIIDHIDTAASRSASPITIPANWRKSSSCTRRCNSCAAPRRPASGFFTSCANPRRVADNGVAPAPGSLTSGCTSTSTRPASTGCNIRSAVTSRPRATPKVTARKWNGRRSSSARARCEASPGSRINCGKACPTAVRGPTSSTSPRAGLIQSTRPAGPTKARPVPSNVNRSFVSGACIAPM
ncbi:hypothetical protein KCV01_g966, partial [Aureobasidium melanogenum]